MIKTSLQHRSSKLLIGTVFPDGRSDGPLAGAGSTSPSTGRRPARGADRGWPVAEHHQRHSSRCRPSPAGSGDRGAGRRSARPRPATHTLQRSQSPSATPTSRSCAEALATDQRCAGLPPVAVRRRQLFGSRFSPPRSRAWTAARPRRAALSQHFYARRRRASHLGGRDPGRTFSDLALVESPPRAPPPRPSPRASSTAPRRPADLSVVGRAAQPGRAGSGQAGRTCSATRSRRGTTRSGSPALRRGRHRHPARCSARSRRSGAALRSVGGGAADRSARLERIATHVLRASFLTLVGHAATPPSPCWPTCAAGGARARPRQRGILGALCVLGRERRTGQRPPSRGAEAGQPEHLIRTIVDQAPGVHHLLTSCTPAAGQRR